MKVYSYFVGGLDENIARGGVYFHGKLEQRAGYDIPSCSSFDIDELSEGVYDVLYNGHLNCKMFFWRKEHWSRGYIVQSDDTKSIEFAEKRFESKPDFI